MDNWKKALKDIGTFLGKFWGLLATLVGLIFIIIFNKRGKTIEHLKAEIEITKASKELEKLKAQEKMDTKTYEEALNRYNALKSQLDKQGSSG